MWAAGRMAFQAKEQRQKRHEVGTSLRAGELWV